MTGYQWNAVEAGLFSKPVEFDGFKTRVVQLLPYARNSIVFRFRIQFLNKMAETLNGALTMISETWGDQTSTFLVNGKCVASRTKSIFQGRSRRVAACAPALAGSKEGRIPMLTQPLAAPPRETRVAERHGLGYFIPRHPALVQRRPDRFESP